MLEGTFTVDVRSEEMKEDATHSAGQKEWNQVFFCFPVRECLKHATAEKHTCLCSTESIHSKKKTLVVG